MRLSLPIYSAAYYLTAPYIFVRKKEKISHIPKGYTLLKTHKTAICASDLHYFLGNKSKEKLQKRLPLILLHEGIALDMQKGIRVVPIAGNFLDASIEYKGKENLDTTLPYMGATADGMAREYFIYPEDLLIPLSPVIPDSVACLMEPLSIVLKAVKDMGIQFSHEIGIIGDGGMAYLLAFILHTYTQIPRTQITVFGIHEKKLEKFSPFAKVALMGTKEKKGRFDITFEAVGGPRMQETMGLALSLVSPGGIVGVVGVSDSLPALDINKIVNQSITIRGLTRSTAFEYEFAHELLKEEYAQKYIENFIHPGEFPIQSAKDLTEAFTFAQHVRGFGRVILSWNSQKK